MYILCYLLRTLVGGRVDVSIGSKWVLVVKNQTCLIYGFSITHLSTNSNLPTIVAHSPNCQVIAIALSKLVLADDCHVGIRLKSQSKHFPLFSPYIMQSWL